MMHGDERLSTGRSMHQTCSRRCGASRLAVSGEPMGRFYCHCMICQAVYKQPYADVTAFPARAVTLTGEGALTFRRYRPPLALDRGRCPVCSAPVVAFMALGPLKMFAFAPSQNFERQSELPQASLHVFYHRRVVDVTDSLPKVSGYWASGAALSRLIFGGMMGARRAA